MAIVEHATLEAAIRALGYAVPFTYWDEKQAARLSREVRARYWDEFGVSLALVEVRDGCGLPPAVEELSNGCR